MTQSVCTLSGTNLLHTSRITSRKIFLPYSPFHWGWYHFFYTLLSWHFWQICWLSDTQWDAHRQNVEGRGMKFFPARSQGCKERPMIGPLPVVAPLGVGLDGSAVHLHPIGPPHPVPQLCPRPHLDKGKARLTLFRPTKETSIVPWYGGACYSSVSMQVLASSWHFRKMGKEMK